MQRHGGLSPVAACVFATVRSIVSISVLYVPMDKEKWKKGRTPMLLIVFPSSSVLTAPQASDASPKADKPALNHMVNKRHCQNWRKRNPREESRRLACRRRRCGQWPLAWWLCVVGWLKVQVRRESDVGALSRPMLQLESLAGLFFCSMGYSNLGSGISCLPFGAAPHGVQ